MCTETLTERQPLGADDPGKLPHPRTLGADCLAELPSENRQLRASLADPCSPFGNGRCGLARLRPYGLPSAARAAATLAASILCHSALSSLMRMSRWKASS